MKEDLECWWRKRHIGADDVQAGGPAVEAASEPPGGRVCRRDGGLTQLV